MVVSVIEMTSRQHDVVNLALELWRDTDATIISKLDPEGEMLLIVIWQNATNICRIDSDGKIVGDWF